jgi:hypothetical protein
MTRKDYVLIATTIADVEDHIKTSQLYTIEQRTMALMTTAKIAIQLGEAFAKDNPNFDEERFHKFIANY